ncbi:MAG: hypothetical protein IJ097_02650 [Bacilli bacterium]|nr:hypothetical protein [Bacilli bacterium]
MKKVKKKIKFKDFINSTITLSIIFVLLLILVIVLTVLCFQKNKELENNGFANMTIPVYELGSNYEFSINAKTLSETDEYIFKIVNYRKELLNIEEIPYTVEIKNDTQSTVKLTMNKSKKDLMKKQQSTILDRKVLSSKEKENIYYHVKITKYHKLSKDDLIYIKITN